MSNKGRASNGAFPSEGELPRTLTNILNLFMQGGRLEEEKTRKRIYHVTFVSIGKQTKTGGPNGD